MTLDLRWYSPGALILTRAFWTLSLLLAVGCAGARARPATPCMSDTECRGERICHEGRCRFPDEVLAELAATPIAPEVGESMTGVIPRSANGFMGDAAHTGRSEYQGPSEEPSPIWTYKTGARIFASPVRGADGTIYVGSLDGQFVALRPEGTLKWRYSAEDKIYPTALIVGTSVLFGSQHGEIISLSLEGQPRWTHPTGDAVDASATLGPDGRVYVAADGVYAFDLLGRLHWHRPTADHVRSAPTIHPARLILFGTTEGTLVALRPDGSIAWETALGVPSKAPRRSMTKAESTSALVPEKSSRSTPEARFCGGFRLETRYGPLRRSAATARLSPVLTMETYMPSPRLASSSGKWQQGGGCGPLRASTRTGAST